MLFITWVFSSIVFIFVVFRYYFRFQIQPEHLLELQIVETKGFGTVHFRVPDDLSVFFNRHAVQTAAGQYDMETVLLGAQKAGWDLRYDRIVDHDERLAVMFWVKFRLLNSEEIAAMFRYRIGCPSLNSISSLRFIGRNLVR